ncbi:MAG: M1 family metallopeptidase [Ferruginibacter sp.]|nr:M1 family metallopeptidase [Ferruginibacter sp.]
MRSILFLLLLISIQFARGQQLTSGGKLKPEQAIMDVRHYTLALTVDITNKSISGYTSIDVLLSEPAPVLIFNLMNDFTVQKVWVNDKATLFTHANELILITPATALPAGKAVVKIQYAGKPHVATRPPWEDGFTWTTDSLGHPFVAVTAEGAGGKIYFPCKDHPSDEPNEGVDMLITVPKDLVVAGPGLLQSVKRTGKNATYHWKTTYSINNYSIVFNIADYTVVKKEYTTINGNKVPMQFYVLKYHAGSAHHHLDLLEEIAKVKEKYFGEYPWAKEKIGLAETPHLGMEHQSMNAYGNNFKYTKVGGQDFDWLMNHEFGHEWWGNKVTAKDWADYWIHEGIGSFGDVLYIRDKEGEAAYINNFKKSIFSIKNEKPVVQGKDLDEETAYIGDIYVKGAFFMHTLRYVIGDSVFFPALNQLATAPQYCYDNLVNTDEVEQLFSKAAGYSVKPMFDLFIRSTNKLAVQVTSMPNNEYKIQLVNLDMALPIDILTENGTQKIMVDKKGVVVKSKVLPQIDSDSYYLKKVIIE